MTRTPASGPAPLSWALQLPREDSKPSPGSGPDDAAFRSHLVPSVYTEPAQGPSHPRLDISHTWTSATPGGRPLSAPAPRTRPPRGAGSRVTRIGEQPSCPASKAGGFFTVRATREAWDVVEFPFPVCPLPPAFMNHEHILGRLGPRGVWKWPLPSGN